MILALQGLHQFQDWKAQKEIDEGRKWLTNSRSVIPWIYVRQICIILLCIMLVIVNHNNDHEHTFVDEYRHRCD